ncbi:MAG TPA: methyltransferase domain-containing protein, partial [Anaerolineae bacterium]|nr:methyltransferase domain-containing protein [Anaerolineae bacterium]
ENAAPWVRAISEGSIESRRLVTNHAIVKAIVQLQPAKVWDIGCGEGWLCRALKQKGIETIGTDAIPALVDAARQQDGGRYELLAYEQIDTEVASQWQADCFVFNFSLFGHDEVNRLLTNLAKALPPGGHIIIQTLHPYAALGEGPYTSGWRQGSWDGFSPDFVNPAPWYYRTLGDWMELLKHCGLQLSGMQEPLHPASGKPVSLVIVAGS